MAGVEQGGKTEVQVMKGLLAPVRTFVFLSVNWTSLEGFKQGDIIKGPPQLQ